MGYDPEIHHRRSIRLPSYDYTQPGAYYEHIVRNPNDLARIQTYIQNNPRFWQDDQLHPNHQP